MRVTIDIDGDELEALIKLLNTLHYTSMFNTRKIEMYKTRRGYHIVVRNLPISFDESLILRMIIGDDPQRIWLDTICEDKPKQVLFTYKKGYNREKLDIDRFIMGVES